MGTFLLCLKEVLGPASHIEAGDTSILERNEGIGRREVVVRPPLLTGSNQQPFVSSPGIFQSPFRSTL